MWRAEDQALLERLEDELLLQRLWRQLAPDAAPVHPRASGLLRLLRELPEGRTAVAEAAARLDGEAGDPAALQALLLSPALPEQPPQLLHHLAVFFERLAEAQEALSPGLGIDARLRSTGAWLALGERGQDYLAKLGGSVAGSDLSTAEVRQITCDVVLVPLEALGRQALSGARARSSQARAALRTLARMDEACKLAALPAQRHAVVLRRAQRHRAAAVDEALAPVREALSDATAQGQEQARAAGLFTQVAAIWHWTDIDEDVERFAVDQITPIAWNVYRDGTWPELRRLLEPVEPLVDSLARRLGADPAKVAYTARCAQMFVFRSECATDSVSERALAERAVAICPSHRNGRLILASLLCSEARQRLQSFALSGAEAVQIAGLLDRAEQLYPRVSGLAELRAKLAEVQRRGGWSWP